MPINNLAYVNISVDVLDMQMNIDELLKKLRGAEGVISAELIAIE